MEVAPFIAALVAQAVAKPMHIIETFIGNDSPKIFNGIMVAAIITKLARNACAVFGAREDFLHPRQNMFAPY